MDVAGTLNCPTGKQPVGGGWNSNATPPFGSGVTLLQSNLTSDGRGWTGSMHNGTNGDVTVTLTVICVTVSSSPAATAAKAAPTQTFSTSSAADR